MTKAGVGGQECLKCVILDGIGRRVNRYPGVPLEDNIDLDQLAGNTNPFSGDTFVITAVHVAAK